MINVLFHYEAGPALRQDLAALEARGLKVSCCDQADTLRFDELLETTDVLWHVLRPVEPRHIHAAPRLKLIQKIGVGVNTIDLEAAKAHGVAVCNMPGTNARAVAEMTLMLMLNALRLQPRLDTLTRSGVWVPDTETRESLDEIGGKTVGLVGMGDIPRILAPILEAMGAKVIYSSRTKKDLPYAHVPLKELLHTADIVSLHVPLTAETEGLMNQQAFRAMKPGSVFINTARGGLVDETALMGALTGGHLKAAGLDVFAEEPVPADNPLLSLDNVIPAPHVAWLTNQTFERSLTVATENTVAVMSGGPLKHQII